MGKLTVAETKALQDEGILSKASVKEMQDKGLVSSRARNEKRVVKTASGTYVTPQFYFQGLNGADYSVDMTSLKDEVANLINKYTKIISK